METVSERLKEAMNDLDINAEELVRKSGVSKQSVSQYVNGHNTPNKKTATALGKALGVDPLWLMGHDVSKTQGSFDLAFILSAAGYSNVPQELIDGILDMLNRYK